MSVQAIGWVFEHYNDADDPPVVRGAARLTLLALANYAGNDELLAWPSVPTIARVTAQTDRAVQKALRELEAAGLIREHGKRRTGTVVYQLLLGGEPGSPPWVNVVREGVNDVQGKGEPGSPEPSLNQKKPSPARPEAPKGAEPAGTRTGKPRSPQNLPQAKPDGCPFGRCDGSHFITDDDTRTARRCECHPSRQAVAA